MTSIFAGSILNPSWEEIQNLINSISQKIDLKINDSKVLAPVGNGSSGVFFLGEAPGPNDAKAGEPLMGPFSQIFNTKLLPSVGLSRQSIYITSVVKNSQPLGQPLPSGLIDLWKPVLPLQIALIKPKLIVCMGKYALEFFLPNVKISEIRGQIFQVQLFNDYSVPILFLIHPANAHRFPEQEEQIQTEFLKIKEFLDGKILPQPLPKEFLENESNTEQLF
jgi:uracil-DNA glycosylase